MTTRQTSGGIPLTRFRLVTDLENHPVHPAYAKRDAPHCWRLVHALDGRRTFGEHATMSDADFEALRSPDIRAAAEALTALGYRITLRHVPDENDLAALSPSLRAQMADTVPTLQAFIDVD